MHLIQPRVATSCIGMAASMGAVLLAGGAKGKRSALPNSRILIHQASAGFQGTASDIEVQAREILRMNARLREMMAADTGKSAEQVGRDTNRDYWMSALEAIPKRILVVDDEPSVRRLLADLFGSEGYLVSEAADGIRGLDVLRETCPDLVILDLMMPVMNGWTFAAECHRTDACRGVPIIAMSAMFDMQSSANALHSLGVHSFLAKPFDVEVLLSLVAKLL